ncbi:hypothetical protein CDAR_586691 [Caerostris darwini]|uniref:Uncharacterized protein n=1 Tax=Caerostris darwini TaxID=1538125 RepID=A0AAV4TNX4_9ARAC|nr:hypothetical protein CDAR_586691 [Caerostris darwini]
MPSIFCPHSSMVYKRHGVCWPRRDRKHLSYEYRHLSDQCFGSMESFFDKDPLPAAIQSLTTWPSRELNRSKGEVTLIIFGKHTPIICGHKIATTGNDPSLILTNDP